MLFLYGISYRMPSYFEKSIESIVGNASEKVYITVVDSFSERSSEIAVIAKRFLSEGKIQRFITSSENCKGYGMFKALKDYPPDDSENFYVTTDLDLIVPEGIFWNELTRNAMLTHELSGYKLSLVNYVPPNDGHTEMGGFGNWLMAIRKGFIEREFPNRQNIVDFELGLRASDSKYQIPVELYHQSWDLWKEDPNYFADKKHTNWLADPSSNCKYEVFQ